MLAGPEERRYDALVIGCGPAGGVCALMLARAGWSVAVVEKTPFPRRKVCGEFISATSLPLLHELGLGEAFAARAGPEVRRVGLYARDRVLDAPMPRVSGRHGAWGRALGREHLDTLLRDAAAAAGADIRQPWNATSLERRAADWLCRIETRDDRKAISAPVVIDAHGSWQRGPGFNPEPRAKRPSDLLAFKAHFRNTGLAADLMPLLVFPGGYGGMVHSDAGRVSLSCCIRRDTLEQCRKHHPARAGEAVLEHISASCAGVRQVLGSAETVGTWLSAGPIRPGIRQAYRNGLFATGNLAGEAHPVIAEGISIAMQSAWLACSALIDTGDGKANPRALDGAGSRYARQWRGSFAARIRVAAAISHLTMRPAAVACWAPLVALFPRILTIGAALAGKARALPTGGTAHVPAGSGPAGQYGKP